MNREEHIKRHIELNKALGELMADYIQTTKCLISKTKVMDLAKWSYEQSLNPTESE